MRGLVNDINMSNVVAVSLLQVKKWRWGKLSQMGDIAFGRQSNRPTRRITEKSLAESLPAEC